LSASAVALIGARELRYWWPKMPFQSQVKARAYLWWPNFKRMLHLVTCYMPILW